ncbi:MULTISPECIES: hypothetical protein [unclassified Phenylobacterium]|jgi:hypothetical protein|uniref:hypothetical protein n=1 Tax=unclassified Phenylobacterium TaxID=2640670 RepID=UPI000B20BF17|nr:MULTISPECIES: hypothetical protein [unclassified Phenylobacterium]
MTDQKQPPKPDNNDTSKVREDEQLKPAPVDRAKDDGGGLSTGVDTGAIQPGNTGDARI